MLWLWVSSFCLWIRDKFLSGHHLINWTESLQRASPTTVVTVNRINLFNIINYPLNTVINLILDKLFVTILICTCLQSKKSDVFDWKHVSQNSHGLAFKTAINHSMLSQCLIEIVLLIVLSEESVSVWWGVWRTVFSSVVDIKTWLQRLAAQIVDHSHFQLVTTLPDTNNQPISDSDCSYDFLTKIIFWSWLKFCVKVKFLKTSSHSRCSIFFSEENFDRL